MEFIKIHFIKKIIQTMRFILKQIYHHFNKTLSLLFEKAELSLLIIIYILANINIWCMIEVKYYTKAKKKI